MSREPGPREKALREMREARFAENAKIATGIRRAAAEGKAIIELTNLPKVTKRKLKKAIDIVSERMKNKPAKGKRKKK